MPFAALLLLIFSGLAHAIWNLYVKRAENAPAFFAAAMLTALACYSPVFFTFFRDAVFASPAWVWAGAAAVGLTEGVYLILLTYTYRREDLSVVYPISRGAAPIFIMAGAVLGLGERLAVVGVAGILITVAGMVVIAWPDTSGRVTGRGVALSILTGAAIAAHHVGYKWLFGYWSPGTAIFLVWLVTASTLTVYAVAVTGVVTFARYATGHLLTALPIGVLALAGFLAALFAIDLTYVSYAGAARNVGVIFSVLFGAKFLREGSFWRRLAGAAAIVAGVTALTLAD